MVVPPKGKTSRGLLAALVLLGLVALIGLLTEKTRESSDTPTAKQWDTRSWNTPNAPPTASTSGSGGQQSVVHQAASSSKREQWEEDADAARDRGDFATVIHILWPLAAGQRQGAELSGLDVPRGLGCAAELSGSVQLVSARS